MISRFEIRRRCWSGICRRKVEEGGADEMLDDRTAEDDMRWHELA